jgi:hypothetical protein
MSNPSNTLKLECARHGARRLLVEPSADRETLWLVAVEKYRPNTISVALDETSATELVYVLLDYLSARKGA